MLKKILLKSLTQRNLRKRTPAEASSYDTATNIGIAVNVKDLNQSRFNDFISTFREEGKKVRILQFDASAKKTVSDKVISGSDISFFGKIRSDHLTKFLNTKYDFLLVIDQESDYHLDYLAGLCQASYRIGFNRDPDSRTLDLQIKPEKNRELDDLLKYTKMIHHV